MRKTKMIGIFLLFLTTLTISDFAQAGIEWFETKHLKLEAKPLDTAFSSRGDKIFVLIKGKILIYSLEDNKFLGHVPVNERFTHLSYSDYDQSFVLTSHSKKELQVIRYDMVFSITITGLPYFGPEKAPITVVVFSDYQCPYCARFESFLKHIQKKYPSQVKVVKKNFPLPNHKFAKPAAIAALAAHKQGKFKPFHDDLMKNFKKLDQNKIQEIATKCGLNMEQFTRDRQNPELEKIVTRDFEDGKLLDVKGTPTAFINGKKLRQTSPTLFQRMLKNELTLLEKKTKE